VKILLARTPNLDAYERSQNQPILREPKYGLDNEQWLTPHSDEGAYGVDSAFNEGHTQTRLETDRTLAEHPSVKPLRERELDFAIANVQ
jgi:hypothetical protein